MTNAAVTTGEGNNNGYWKVGCGNLPNWQNADSSTYNGPSYFTGRIHYAAVYSVALSAAQVQEDYSAGP